MSSLSNNRIIGQKLLSEALQVVPNSATDVVAKDAWIFQLTVNNKTASPVTLTVTDKNTSPLDLLTAVSIAGNTTYVISFPEGQFMKGGIRWVASAATSLNAGMVAFSVL